MEFGAAFAEAFRRILTLDPDLVEIILLSLRVSLSAVAVAALIGLPLGAALAVTRFPGRGALVLAANALMGLPPVVVGLVVYLMLSRAGPLGTLGLLYTPAAMIIAQTILIAPIVTALTRQVILDLHALHGEELRIMGASPREKVGTLLVEGRHALGTVILAGLGRALAEVGAVMIVGGNIDHVTRVMTTAIALETSKGDLGLALGLGMVLLVLALAINAAVMGVQSRARAPAHG